MVYACYMILKFAVLYYLRKEVDFLLPFPVESSILFESHILLFILPFQAAI
jgi:hypothetical protein